MTEGALFAIGSVVFILVSAAILWYGYARFQEVYLHDQREAAGPSAELVVTTDAAGNE